MALAVWTRLGPLWWFDTPKGVALPTYQQNLHTTQKWLPLETLFVGKPFLSPPGDPAEHTGSSTTENWNDVAHLRLLSAQVEGSPGILNIVNNLRGQPCCIQVPPHGWEWEIPLHAWERRFLRLGVAMVRPPEAGLSLLSSVWMVTEEPPKLETSVCGWSLRSAYRGFPLHKTSCTAPYNQPPNNLFSWSSLFG